MNQTSELRSKAVAAGSALLITTIWMAGLGAMLQHGTARAEPAVQRMDEIVVQAKRLNRFERMDVVVVTAHRAAQEYVATARPTAVVG